MNIQPDFLPPEEMGKRLRIARESRRLTQAEAAQKIGISRTTLVAIEQGSRLIRSQELRALTDLYKVTMNQLLRRDAIHVDLVPRFRKLAELDDPGIDEAASLLNVLVSAEVELENLLGIQRGSSLPPERTLLPGDVCKQAEDDAIELRKWIGLGVSPVPDMLSLLELELGIRVYVRPLKSNISGLFAYDDSVGACILINSLHPEERQIQTCSHELGHIVSTRRKPEVYQDKAQYNSREERYAHAFGRAFLMPARAVMQKFKEITAGAKRLTRRHVIILAHYFGVSREALVRRLEELGLAPDGTWDWFTQNGGISNAQAEEVLGRARHRSKFETVTSNGTSLRLGTLVAEAMDRGLLSEGQVARLLKIDRVEVRRLRYKFEDGDGEFYQLSE